MKIRVLPFFILVLFLTLSGDFSDHAKAQTSLPWPHAQAIAEEYQNLKLQADLYFSMDPQVAGSLPEFKRLEEQLNAKLGQIERHASELEKSSEGKALSGFSRKFKLVRQVQTQLAECYQSRKAQGAARAIVQALNEQSEDCEAFRNEASFTQILTTLELAARAEGNDPKNQEAQRKLLNTLFMNTLLQSAQRYAELGYLVTDLNISPQDFYQNLCGSGGWCERMENQASLEPGQTLKSTIEKSMAARLESLRGTPQRTSAEIGKGVKCELFGCDGARGLYTKLDHNFARRLESSGPLSMSLDLLEQSGASHLNLSGLNFESSPWGPSDPEELERLVQEEDQKTFAVEQQAQDFLAEHLERLESDPALRILSARIDISADLCLGGCRAQVGLSPTSGAYELSFVNSRGDRPELGDLLHRIYHQPERALKSYFESTKGLLTDGLSSIGQELFPGTPLSPAALERHLGRLIGGNPTAAAQTLMQNPELLPALCEALKKMDDDNPWLEILGATGGIGAVVIGGVVGGPVGLAVASAAVGLGSATYGYSQYRRHSSLARHYQVSCYNEVDPISSSQCRTYHQELMVAQLNLLGAGVDIATLGSFSTYRRVLTQTLARSSELGRSLRHLHSVPALVREVRELMGESTAQLLDRTLANSTVQEREAFVSLYRRAKTYLNEDNFQRSVRESVAQACGLSTTR